MSGDRDRAVGRYMVQASWDGRLGIGPIEVRHVSGETFQPVQRVVDEAYEDEEPCDACGSCVPVDREGHQLVAPSDSCGQRWCPICEAHMTPRCGSE